MAQGLGAPDLRSASPSAARRNRTPAQKPPTKPAPPAADRPPPSPDAANPEASEEGAIFLALLDAGADARVAHTAKKRLHTMISDAITPQFQALMEEMTRRFDELAAAGAERDRRLDGIDRRLDGIDRRLNEHDRKLGVLAAQMRLLFGAMGLLVTVLIAVFGFLFANTN